MTNNIFGCRRSTIALNKLTVCKINFNFQLVLPYDTKRINISRFLRFKTVIVKYNFSIVSKAFIDFCEIVNLSKETINIFVLNFCSTSIYLIHVTLFTFFNHFSYN